MRSPSREPLEEQRHAASRRRLKGGADPRDHLEPRDSRNLAPEEERGSLVGVGPAPDPAGHMSMLDELAELVRTAGGRVVGRLYQRRDHPHPASYLGGGKVTELLELDEELDATMVVTDTDLTPAQVRHLEDALDVKVVDRSELILDIFAIHARTRQSRLQVELAQLRYLSPRLKRMWTHLSRITGSGGIGSRGPGEKQIEVDRRIIQRRIRDLGRELDDIERRRERVVRNREGQFKVALVGYTNAGKSTLMRRMTGSDVLVADQLFATLDTRTRRWEVTEDTEVLLSDTVGFIQKLPHHLVACFHATLEEVREADLLLHVADAGDPEVAHRIQVVRDVLEEIGAGSIPEILLLNKCDLLADPVESTILSQRLDEAIAISAVTGQGLEALRRVVRDRAGRGHQILELRVPVADGRTLARLADRGRILRRDYQDGFSHLTVSLPAAAAAEFQRFTVSPPEIAPES